MYFREGYIELVNARGFLRCFHYCRFGGEEPFGDMCALRSIHWRLQSLAVVGILPPGCTIPPVHDLRSLTFGVTQDDATPPAFGLSWPCPLLSEMRLASNNNRGFTGPQMAPTVEMSAPAVSNFVSTLLEHAQSLSSCISTRRAWTAMRRLGFGSYTRPRC